MNHAWDEARIELTLLISPPIEGVPTWLKMMVRPINVDADEFRRVIEECAEASAGCGGSAVGDANEN